MLLALGPCYLSGGPPPSIYTDAIGAISSESSAEAWSLTSWTANVTLHPGRPNPESREILTQVTSIDFKLHWVLVAIRCFVSSFFCHLSASLKTGASFKSPGGIFLQTSIYIYSQDSWDFPTTGRKSGITGDVTFGSCLGDHFEGFPTGSNEHWAPSSRQ